MKPHFRLWHLFAFTALVAVGVFVGSYLGIIFEWQPKTTKTARHLWINIYWDGECVFDFDSWPPPDDPGPPPARMPYAV